MANQDNVANHDNAAPSPRLSLHKKPAKPSRKDVAIEIYHHCLNQKDELAAAITLVNEVAFHLKCDRVSIGLKFSHHTHILAISNNASFDAKSNLVRSIEAAMDEAIDESKRIMFPLPTESKPQISIAHERLSRTQNGRTICSIPFKYAGQFVGSLCLEQSQDSPFESEQIDFCEVLASISGPVLYLLQREHRGLAKTIYQSFSDTLKKVIGPEKLILKSIVGTITLFSIIFSIISGDYRVTSTAVLQGSTQRVISTPFDGYIATAQKRAGDSVLKGDLIATLNDRDLSLEAVKWNSQRQQLRREYRESLAMGNRTRVSILNAKIEQTEAQLALVNEQLSRLQISSPFDGVIIEGDLTQSIGSPVSRGDVLFKIAPKDDYRVILEVDESDISYIETGQSSQLLLSSFPDEIFTIKITRITPVSVAQEGRNFFRVEAKIDTGNTLLQPGMEGIGKIHIGERKLVWIYTHKILDRLRLILWAIWP